MYAGGSLRYHFSPKVASTVENYYIGAKKSQNISYRIDYNKYRSQWHFKITFMNYLYVSCDFFFFLCADSLNLLCYTFGTGKLVHISELSQSTLANRKRIHSNWFPTIQSHWAQLAGFPRLCLFSTPTRQSSEENKDSQGRASTKTLQLQITPPILLLLLSVNYRGTGHGLDSRRSQKSGLRGRDGGRWEVQICKNEIEK